MTKTKILSLLGQAEEVLVELQEQANEDKFSMETTRELERALGHVISYANSAKRALDQRLYRGTPGSKPWGT